MKKRRVDENDDNGGQENNQTVDCPQDISNNAKDRPKKRHLDELKRRREERFRQLVRQNANRNQLNAKELIDTYRPIIQYLQNRPKIVSSKDTIEEEDSINFMKAKEALKRAIKK